MNRSITSLLVIVLGFFGGMSQAYAGTKVAEFGDPVLGNDFNNCTFTQVYGTGGIGYEYKEYQVTCPEGAPRGAVDEKVGVVRNSYPYVSCTFYPSSGHYMQGNCNNWRLYRN